MDVVDRQTDRLIEADYRIIVSVKGLSPDGLAVCESNPGWSCHISRFTPTVQ